MANDLHLSPRHRRVLEALLREHLPDVEVWAYRSRVNGRSHDGSDLDLVLRGPGLEEIPAEQVTDFAKAVRESTIPFFVEARDWAVLPERFQRKIESQHVVLLRHNLPNCDDWRDAPLGSVITCLSGGTPSKGNPAYWGGSIPWVSAKDMKRYRLSDTQDHITLEGATSGTRVAPKGSVLLLTRGMTLLNSVPVCLIDRDMAFNQDVKALKPGPDILPDYLPYLVLGNTQYLKGLVDLAGHGTGRLNSAELKALRICVPPKDQQRAIAQILGTLDDKIELNRRMNETLEAMARALFKSWFVDFEPVRAKMAGRDTGLPQSISILFPAQTAEVDIGRVPVGWRTFKLDEIVTHHTATVSPSATPDTPFEHFSIPAYDADQTPPLELGTTIKSNKTLVPDSAVLLSKLNPDIPRIWTPSRPDGVPQICSTEFLAFSPVAPVSRSFLFSLFSDDTFQTMLRSLVTGTSKSHQRVPPKSLKDQTVTAGDRHVFRAFEALATPWLNRVIANRTESNLLARTRDALLPELISGKIRVADAEMAVEAVT